MAAKAELGVRPAAEGRWAAQRAIAPRWWRQAAPVPSHQVPTLRRPAAAYDLGGGEVLEVHRDETGTCRAILVRRKGDAEEVRLLL